MSFEGRSFCKLIKVEAEMGQKKYRKREKQLVIAVQLNLDTDGFTYTKWGGEQKCAAGDWLVSNDGDCYTIGKDSFANTYEAFRPGQYIKTAPVWASEADEAGEVKTNEGTTEYRAGDYLVFNAIDGSDSYAVSKHKFEEMYEELSED